MKATVEEKKRRVILQAERFRRQLATVNDIEARLKASPLITDAEAGIIANAIFCAIAVVERKTAKDDFEKRTANRNIDEFGGAFFRLVLRNKTDIGQRNDVVVP